MILLSFSLILTSCKKDKDKTELPYMYAGAVQVEYSKGFPSFMVKASNGVLIAKDGTVTFDNDGKSNNFDAEDVYYEDGSPVTKFRYSGTLKFVSAAGNVREINNTYYVMVKVHSFINGTAMIWGWDDDMGWINVQEIPYIYEETFSDGELQFSMDNASGLNGQDIKKTLPDLTGTFTYGYNLTLAPG
jgi:hypothetical protein